MNAKEAPRTVKVYMYLQGWNSQVRDAIFRKALIFLRTHRGLSPSDGVIRASPAEGISGLMSLVDPLVGEKVYIALFYPKKTHKNLSSLNELRHRTAYDWEAFELSQDSGSLFQPFASADPCLTFQSISVATRGARRNV